MDENKYITTNLPASKTDYDYLFKDNTYFHTIYIFKFNKNMELIRYKSEAILGKRSDGKIYIIHAKYRSRKYKTKEIIQYYERIKANKTLESDIEYINKHSYDFTIKIDCICIDDGSDKSNYAVPMVEGQIYSDTVWYLDENHSLKEFVGTLMNEKEEAIKNFQRHLNTAVEKYNTLSLFYDNLGGNNETNN